jgi:hypothetical protein
LEIVKRISVHFYIADMSAVGQTHVTGLQGDLVKGAMGEITGIWKELV